jgi:excisionase family DNA binding protein
VARQRKQAIPGVVEPGPSPAQLSLTRDDPALLLSTRRRTQNRKPPAVRASGGASRSDEPFYTVAQLASRLSLSERTVRDMLNRGEIPCYRIGPQRRIDPDDLRQWLEQRRERR